jgi:mannan endo-1,6-alpha-mannosidase
MKLSSCVQVLGLRISAVVAIHLDIHSPGIRSSIENDRATLTRTDSIKQSAKLLSENLRQYYTGDLEGGTPGLLPLPYHWWQCGAMLNTFIDYWYYTGDDQYNAMAAQALEHQIGEYDAFMPANQTRSLGNDDQAFWGMAAMSAAESRLPDLGGGKPSWLSLAQAVFNTPMGPDHLWRRFEMADPVFQQWIQLQKYYNERLLLQHCRSSLQIPWGRNLLGLG